MIFTWATRGITFFEVSLVLKQNFGWKNALHERYLNYSWLTVEGILDKRLPFNKKLRQNETHHSELMHHLYHFICVLPLFVWSRQNLRWLLLFILLYARRQCKCMLFNYDFLGVWCNVYKSTLFRNHWEEADVYYFWSSNDCWNSIFLFMTHSTFCLFCQQNVELLETNIIGPCTFQKSSSEYGTKVSSALGDSTELI